MARKKRSRKSSDWQDTVDQVVAALFRPEVGGLLLIVVSAFTLLSLVTGSRGRVTGWWIDRLQEFVGIGVWGLPLVAGLIGLWIVIRRIDQMPNLPWQRPAGLVLLFLAFITGTALFVASDPAAAGGWLGMQIATLMGESAGNWGAWAVVTFTAMLGFVLLTNGLLLELGYTSWLHTQEWYDRYRYSRRSPIIQPSLPIPSGKIPWWKRLRDSLNEPPKTVGRDIVTRVEPYTPAMPAARPAAVSAAAALTNSPNTPPPARPPGSATDILTPRIVGGVQEWRLPQLNDMLNDWERQVDSDEVIRRQGRLIQETLGLFGVPADFEGAYKGPSVTQYLIKPGYVERTIRGEQQRVKVKVSKIAGLANDLALALAASSVRIEAPIPGTNYVGVEVPNQESNVVGLKELMESETFQQTKGKLRIALGEDVKGQPVVSDLSRMPHLLIAGATGTGKSVCINSIVACLLLTHTPDTLRFLMIDPKMVELSVYNGIPHLLSPVVTEVDRAAAVLFWAVKEMERRYQLLNKAGARDLERYNAYLVKRGERPLPTIVIVVDEMADLMMASPEEVEKHICRIAQMARAVGMHLIIATQRPSVDVITGLIKANFPARIAFAVTSQIDSRVILDVPGAERLLGRGDMLFMSSDATRLDRLQGAYPSDEEISRIIRYWKGIRSFEDDYQKQTGLTPLPDPLATPSDPTLQPDDSVTSGPANATGSAYPSNEPSLEQAALFREIEKLKATENRDELFDEAVRVVREAGRGSVSLLQRKLRVGYSRASRLVDQLEQAGILGPDLGGSQGRLLLIDGNTPADSQPLPAPHIVGAEEEDAPAAPPRIWM